MPADALSNDVDVWRLDLADQAWGQGLAPGQTRAAAQSQRAWRGARHLLAHRLQVSPDALRFKRGDAGKPLLCDETLQFNIAHSGDLALIALSPAAVGVDLERTKPIEPDLDDLARSILQSRELAVWRAAPQGRRLSLFYAAWVRKEAYLKLTGLGLRKPMTDLRVIGQDDLDLAVLDTAPDANGASGHLRDLDIAPAFAAAVCTPRPAASVVVRTLSPQHLIADAANV